MWSFCYDKHSPAELLFLCWWTCNLNIVPSTCEMHVFKETITVPWGTKPAAAIKSHLGQRRSSSCWWTGRQGKDHFSISGTPGAGKAHTPGTELRGASIAVEHKLQPNFSSKASLLLWDFLARCIVLTPRGWSVRHSFIPTCKGRNRRSRAAAFFTLPICFQWLVLSPCSWVRPQLRKTFIQHMPKSHWPDWASGLCLRFVLNQGLIDGIFFSAHLNIETQDCNTVYWNVPLPLFHQLMNLVERPSVTGCCNCGKNWTLHLSFHSVR